MESRKKKLIKELIKKPSVRNKVGLYVTEGPKIAAEVDESMVEEIFITENLLKSPNFTQCKDLVLKKGYTLISESEMREISDLVTPQGILMILRKKQIQGLELFALREREYAENYAPWPPLLLILETLQDPGNLGTLLRSAESSGVTGVIADENTVDLYSPKVVRATMGTIFRIPYLTVSNLWDTVSYISQGQMKTWGHVHFYAATVKGTIKYTDADFKTGCALILGNESKGLSREILELADDRIYIPMRGKTESLNVSVAAAVLGFEALRQRSIAT